MGDSGEGRGVTPLTIRDGLLTSSLPAEVQAVVADLCQGDVLVSRLPLVYLAGTAHPMWAPTADYLVSPSGEDFTIVVHEGGEEPARWVITSQTCDIGKPNWPWIQVAPVFDMNTDDLTRVVNRKGPEYLWYLPALPDGAWVADLRVEVPVEKSLLLGCKTLRGHVTEADAAAFGTRLAYLRSRAALADDLVVTVQAPLRSALLTAAKSPLFTILERGEVHLRTDSQLKPSWAQIVVIQDAKEHEAVADWWGSQWENLSSSAGTVGINLLPTELRSPESMNLTVYRNLIPFPLSGLSEALPDY